MTSIEHKRDRLQRNLSLLRTSAGWSGAQLGEKLGVSRQQISNLETGQNKMSIIQYRAIRQVFSEEIDDSPQDTAILKDLLLAIVDEPEKFTDQQLHEILADANLLTPSIMTKKTTRQNAAKKWVAALAGAAVAAVVAGVAVGVEMIDKKQ